MRKFQDTGKFKKVRKRILEVSFLIKMVKMRKKNPSPNFCHNRQNEKNEESWDTNLLCWKIYNWKFNLKISNLSVRKEIGSSANCTTNVSNFQSFIKLVKFKQCPHCAFFLNFDLFKTKSLFLDSLKIIKIIWNKVL